MTQTMRERLIGVARTKLEASAPVVDAGLCASIVDAILTVQQAYTPKAGDVVTVKPDGSVWVSNTTPCVAASAMPYRL